MSAAPYRVDPQAIVKIFGRERDISMHLGRIELANGQLAIMHSQLCIDSGRDLLECPFTLAIPDFIPEEWPETEPFSLRLRDGELVMMPLRT